MRRSSGSECGFTLVELLLAMTMSLMVCGAGLMLMGTAEKRNSENTERAHRINAGQVALERMTRELRQANWLVFRSSMTVDLDVPVRPGPTQASVRRLVRYDCSSGARCMRYEGAPTGYPPPVNATFTRTLQVLEDLRSRKGIFRPHRVDPATGANVIDFLSPTAVELLVEIDVPPYTRPAQLQDGVTLRNAAGFRS